MSQQRYRREDAGRTEPIRNFGATFRPSEASGGGDSWTAPPDWMDGAECFDTAGAADTAGYAGYAGADPADFATNGVRMSYDLLREQISRGYDFARNVNSSVGTKLPDIREITERVLSFYSQASMEAALFWINLLSPGRRPQPPPAPWPSSIPVTVFSSRPARGSVQLRPRFDPAVLQACQLWSRDTTKPPLMDVAFLTGQQGKVYLKVQVPDNQPADLYLGVACDRTTGEPLGTIAVHITQP